MFKQEGYFRISKWNKTGFSAILAQ